VVIRSAAHSLMIMVGVESQSDSLLRQLNRVLEISDSVAGLKVEKISVRVKVCARGRVSTSTACNVI